MRLSRLVAIERVRTRIATDLHDDIGASLTQIAPQSEVLRRELGGASPDSERRLARIGEVSRQLVDTMSDIVWAISPRRDRFHDLAQRMRRFALDTLDARGIALQFEVSDAHRDLPLPADARREVYLSFKECVTNAARHSGCRTVDVALRVAGRAVELSVRDDGTGFDAGAEGEGTGLQSLRRRVGALRGSVAIRSERGVGTSVTLSFPLK
jgi:signal transduction histidine kinase